MLHQATNSRFSVRPFYLLHEARLNITQILVTAINRPRSMTANQRTVRTKVSSFRGWHTVFYFSHARRAVIITSDIQRIVDNVSYLQSASSTHLLTTLSHSGTPRYPREAPPGWHFSPGECHAFVFLTSDANEFSFRACSIRVTRAPCLICRTITVIASTSRGNQRASA
jgi:hypothetical protein